MIKAKGIRILCYTIMVFAYTAGFLGLLYGVDGLGGAFDTLSWLITIGSVLLPMIITVSLYPLFALANIETNLVLLNNKLDKILKNGVSIEESIEDDSEEDFVDDFEEDFEESVEGLGEESFEDSIDPTVEETPIEQEFDEEPPVETELNDPKPIENKPSGTSMLTNIVAILFVIATVVLMVVISLIK